MPGCHRRVATGLALLLMTSCSSAGWVPSLTVGLQGVRRGRSARAEVGQARAAFYMKADARLGWQLETATRRARRPVTETASAPPRARPAVRPDAPGTRQCRSEMLCAWERREWSRALGALVEDEKP